MFSRSISAGLALATAHVQPAVARMTAASCSRFFSVSFFESLISRQSPATSRSARSSGTDTAAA